MITPPQPLDEMQHLLPYAVLDVILHECASPATTLTAGCSFLSEEDGLDKTLVSALQQGGERLELTLQFFRFTFGVPSKFLARDVITLLQRYSKTCLLGILSIDTALSESCYGPFMQSVCLLAFFFVKLEGIKRLAIKKANNGLVFVCQEKQQSTENPVRKTFSHYVEYFLKRQGFSLETSHSSPNMYLLTRKTENKDRCCALV